MFQTVAAWIAAFIAVAVCGFALWRGPRPARIAGGIFLAAWLASPLVSMADPMQVEWVVFGLDVAVLAAFLTLTLRFKRLWLMGASAFQLLTVATHFAMLVDYRVTLNSYILVLGLWSLAALACILVGALGKAEVPTLQNRTH